MVVLFACSSNGMQEHTVESQPSSSRICTIPGCKCSNKNPTIKEVVQTSGFEIWALCDQIDWVKGAIVRSAYNYSPSKYEQIIIPEQTINSEMFKKRIEPLEKNQKELIGRLLNVETQTPGAVRCVLKDILEHIYE